MKLIDLPVIVGIRLYRRFISPHKGFKCAHYQMHKGDTCSGAVLDVVRTVGLIKGWPAIARRFAECNQAARRLRHQRADMDCGLGGCLDFGGDGGCGLFDWGGTDASSSNAGVGFCIAPCIWIPGARTRTGQTVSAISLGVVFVFGGLLLWFTYGSNITSIEIALKDGVEEVRDRAIPGMPGSELPDYQALFTVKGREYKSAVLTDTSAAGQWLSLSLKQPINRGDISKIEIVNKQLLGAQVLDTIDPGTSSGEGSIYRYKLVPRWHL